MHKEKSKNGSPFLRKMLALAVAACMLLTPGTAVFATDNSTDAQSSDIAAEEVTAEESSEATEASDEPAVNDEAAAAPEEDAEEEGGEKTPEPEELAAPPEETAADEPAEDMAEQEEADTKSVQLTAQKGGKFLFAPKLSETVSSDLSDEYGFTGADKYTDGNAVSLLDILIRAHELAYGNAFTAETVKNYLDTEISSSGKVVVCKMFEKEGNYYNFDFAVNGRLPGQEYPCGQNIDFYPINSIHPADGDVIEFFVEQNGAKDEYSWLERGGSYIKDLTVQQNKDTSVKVKGIKYFVQANRYGDADRMKEDGELLQNVMLATVNMQTGELTPIEGSEADENGVIKINMPDKGKYYVVVTPTDAADAPTIIMTLMELTVTDSPDPEAVAPETITIVPDAKKIVKHTYQGYSGEQTVEYFMCTEKNGKKLKLKAVDQNGNETPVSWTGTSANYIKFEDSTEGTATITNTTSYSSTVTVTAESMIEGCDVKGTYKFSVIPALAARAGYSGNYTNPVDVSFTMDPETGRFGEIKPGSLSIIAGSDYVSNGMVDIRIADESIVSAATSYSSVNLTPLKPGKTTVTICDKYDDQNCVTINVDVKGVVVKAGNDVRNTKTYVGGTKQLSYESASAEDTITWSSSDESIATVNENGLVTGVSKGAAKIYAQTQDGDKGVINVGVLPTEDSVVMRNLVIKSPSDFYTDENYSSRLTSKSGTDDDYAGPSGNLYTISGYWVDTYADIDEKYYVKSNTTKMTFFPLFSSDVKVEAYLDGKQVASGESAKDMAVNLHPLMNEVEVRAVDAADPTITNSYKFHVYRDRSETATMNMMTVKPADRETSSTLQFAGNAEGTLFIMNDSWEYKKPSWGSGYNTVSSYSGVGTNYNTRAHVFGDVDAFTVDLTASDAEGAHIRYAIGDSDKYTEGTGTLTTKKISFGTGRDEMIIKVQSVSDKVYADCEEAETDPWGDDTVKTYYLSVKQIPVEPSELGLKSLDTETEGCIQMEPGFSETNPILAVMVPADVTELDVKATPNSNDVSAYCHSSSYNLITDQYKQTPAEDGSYTINIKPTSSYGNDRYFALAKDVDGMIASAQYQIKIEKITAANDREGLADEVAGFLSIGGSSTNSDASYGPSGLYPERSIKSTGAYAQQLNLGSFGGFVTYYYKDGIRNDPNNPYGIDFTVFARSVSDSNPAASSVFVSEDGDKWYELAGSEHYDNDTVWNYSVDYTDANGIAEFTDSFGRSGSTGYAYPAKGNYPKYEGKMHFEGTLLLGANGENYDSTDASVMPYSWGYVGAHKPGSIASGKPVAATTGNPYVADYDGYGDGYDISWAVDENGKPVRLDSVNYVKVMSASMIRTSAADKGGQGRVGNVVASKAGDGSAVGISAPPSCIRIDGKEIRLESGKDVYDATVSSDDFDVEVEAAEGSNVFINNLRSAARSYSSEKPFDFNKGIIRVIVQEGSAEPAICYVNIVKEDSPLNDASEKLNEAEEANEAAAKAAEEAAALQEAADKAIETPGEEAATAATAAKKAADEAVNKAEAAEKAAEEAVKAAEAAVESAGSEAEKKKAGAVLDKANAALAAAKSAAAQAKSIAEIAALKERLAKAEAANDAAEKAAAEKALAEAMAKTVNSVTVDARTVNASAVAEAVRNAGGSGEYVTEIVIGKGVRKISRNAFAGTKVNTLIVKTKKLKKKSVKGSLKGSSVKTVRVQIGSKKVNKKYIKKYKKIFTKKNAGRKAKVK